MHPISAEGLPVTVDELMKGKVNLSEWYFHRYCWLGTTYPGMMSGYFLGTVHRPDSPRQAMP